LLPGRTSLRFVTAGAEAEAHSARLWEVSGDEDFVLYEAFPHELPVWSMALSPDDRWLVTGGMDHEVRFSPLDRTLATPLPTLNAHEGPVSALAISFDNRWLATGSWDHNVFLWEFTPERPAAMEPKHRLKHDGAVSAVAFGSENRWLITAGEDKKVRLWDLDGMEELPPFFDDTGNPSEENAIVLTGHDGTVRSVKVSDTKPALLASGADDGTVRLWRLDALHSPIVSRLFRGHDLLGGPRLAVDCSSRWLATTCTNHQIRLWNAQSHREYWLAGHTDDAYDIAFSPDGKWLISGSKDGTLRLWSVGGPDSPSLNAQHVLDSRGEPIRDFVIGPDSTWLVSCTERAGDLLRWDLTASDIAGSSLPLNWPNPQEEEYATVLAADANNRWLAAGGSGGSLLLFDIRQANPNFHVRLNCGKSSVTHLQFTAMPRWLFVATEEGCVFRFDVLEDNPSATRRRWPDHDTTINQLATDSNQRWLAIAGSSGLIRLWSLGEETPTVAKLTLRGHDAEVLDLAFSPDGRHLISGDRRGVVALWDLSSEVDAATRTLLRGHQDGVTQVIIDPATQWFATASWDQTVMVWDWNPSIQRLMELAKRTAGRELTNAERKLYLPNQR
jgi:WD40 repeat protein